MNIKILLYDRLTQTVIIIIIIITTTTTTTTTITTTITTTFTNTTPMKTQAYNIKFWVTERKPHTLSWPVICERDCLG
jgi:hypothetical protein